MEWVFVRDRRPSCLMVDICPVSRLATSKFQMWGQRQIYLQNMTKNRKSGLVNIIKSWNLEGT